MIKLLRNLAIAALWSAPIWAGAAAADSARPGAMPQFGGELRVSLRSDPKTFDPLIAADESSFLISYLTHGRLMRVDHQTQLPQPDLAESWKVQDGGRKILITLREGVAFSDGSPLTAEDVVFTITRLTDKAVRSPMADQLRTSKGTVTASVAGRNKVIIALPAPVAGIERVFDSVPVLPAPTASSKRDGIVAGPFVLAEHKPGAFLLLKRNPHYWKKDPSGRRLPYVDSIRFFIQSNRDLELTRFERGEIDLIEGADAETFKKLVGAGSNGIDAGPAFHAEFYWFNQAPGSPLAPHKRAWFESKEFRRAISEAIPRQDLVRLAFFGRAVEASGPISEANTIWFRKGQKPHNYNPDAARKRLEKAGFRYSSGKLTDAKGNPVEFSVITNADNATRLRMASMIQQDLAKIGIRLNIVPLDFRSLVDRIGRTLDYETCLLSLVNLGPDPSDQTNLWLSSAPQHMWNPNQKTPATPWEAEIDTLMRSQSEAPDDRHRKAFVDRLQEIVWEQAPVIYLVNPHALAAAGTRVRNVKAAAMTPRLLWRADQIWLEGSR